MPPENIGEMAQSLPLCGMVETFMGWPRTVLERGQGKEWETLHRREIAIVPNPPKTVSLSASPHPCHQPQVQPSLFHQYGKYINTPSKNPTGPHMEA